VIVQTDGGPKLMLIDAQRGQVTPLDQSWFNEANYDLGYQGLVDCLTIPDARLVVVSVQRSSQLVTVNLDTNTREGSIPLAGRGGNPTLTPLSGLEFAASDYDCLCIVNARTGEVRASAPLQVGGASNTQQFIGDYDVNGGICAVARPFSGDVLFLDLENFSVRAQVPASGQPLAICTVSRSRFVTRDWKTGKVSLGQLPK
jgi:hypothetical protein